MNEKLVKRMFEKYYLLRQKAPKPNPRNSLSYKVIVGFKAYRPFRKRF
jgi:hypothetical protein